MKKFTIFVLLFSWLVLVGCGGGGANVNNNNPTTVAKEWQGAVQVDNLPSSQELIYILNSKNLSVNQNGYAALSWTQIYNNHPLPYISFYDFDNNSWSQPEKIYGSTHIDTIEVKTVTDNNKNVVAAWIGVDNGHKNLYLRKYVYGSGWDTFTHIVEQSNEDVDSFDLAYLNNRAVVSWVQKDGSNKKCHTRIFDFSTGHTSNIYKFTASSGDVSYTTVGIDKNGNIMLAWKQRVGTVDHLFAKRYNYSTSNWGVNKQLDNLTYHANIVKLDMNRDGDVAFVWNQYDGSNSNTYLNFYNHTTDKFFTVQSKLNQQNTETVDATVSLNDNSDMIVAWRQKNSNNKYDVYAKIYNKSLNKWSNAKKIENINDDNSAYFISANIDNNRNAVVTWEQKDNNIYSVYANNYNSSDDNWSGDTELENSDKLARFVISKIDKNGNAIAAWMQKNSANKMHLYSNVYR